MTIIYGSAISPFVRKVLMTLEEKQVTYKNIPMPPHFDHPAFQAISVLGKIPAFEDDQIATPDSTVICQYLEKRYPEPALIPLENIDYVKTLWLNEYATNTFAQVMLKPYAHHLVLPKIFKKPCDARIGDEALEKEIPVCFAYLESQVASDYFIGKALTLADVSIIAFLQCFYLLGHEVDKVVYPKLHAFYQRAAARESVAKIMQLAQSAMQQFI